ncbi:MAG: NAD(P)/FAD-dependent oxidoreductase [Thermodesulfobacteriota bacterium]
MPLPVETWDVLVVGAGPAGSCAAAESARLGAKTLLIDAKPRIGEQPHCGEFVPSRLFGEIEMDRAAIVQPVHVMETIIVDSWDEARREFHGPARFTDAEGRRAETHSPGFIIDRVRFDRHLARRAASHGAMVMSGTRLVRKEESGWLAQCGGREVVLRAKYVIAADGALSCIARTAGMKRPEVLIGTQVEAPLVRSDTRTYVFLHRDLTDGYGWVFPKGPVANVGIGVSRRKGASPHSALGEFLEYLYAINLVKPGWLARSGGVIPVSGPRESLVSGNVLFCGDAAGLTHAITGAGIPQAVISGTLAGRTVAEALAEGTASPLRKYEAEVKGHYAAVLNHALSKREHMVRRWHDPDFVTICHESWIAFEGYRRRVRPQQLTAAK